MTGRMEDVQVAVLMGGLGTRLGLADRPKSMADVHGHPFFDYQLRLLKSWGFSRFLFLVGHMGEAVRKHYGDGSSFGVSIRYSEDGDFPRGTGGAVRQAAHLLDRDFLLIYGDSFMDIDYQGMMFHYMEARQEGKHGLMAILRNSNRLDRSNVMYGQGENIYYDKLHPVPDMEYIDYGVSFLQRASFESVPRPCFDLADLLREMSQENMLAGHVVNRRFYEIGSPDALEEFRSYAYGRFVEQHPAVFLDRDGVVNELVFHDETEQLDSPFAPEDFRYVDGAVDGMRWMREQGYSIFIVTNQPAAAKGKVPLEQICRLNEWMLEDLRKKGVEVEAVRMCPHHPKGMQKTKYPYLIRACGCRKPRPGLISSIFETYSIDRSNTLMIGDSHTDVLAAQNAGIHSVFFGELKCDACHRLGDAKPDAIIRGWNDIKNILEGKPW